MESSDLTHSPNILGPVEQGEYEKVSSVNNERNNYNSIHEISARNENVVIEGNPRFAVENQGPHLARSISEVQLPIRSQVSSCSNDPSIQFRRPPGRMASFVPLSVNASPVLKKSHSSNSLVSQGIYQRKPRQQRSGKGMVLQVVLPVNGMNNNFNIESINSPGTYEEIPESNSLKERKARHHPSSIYSLQEYPASETSGHVNNVYIPNERNHRQVQTPTAMSNVGSIYGPDSPTPVEEKKKAFTDVLTKTLSLFYALLNVTLGLALYVSDIVDGSHSGSEIFSLVLVLIAFSYVLYLTIDINLYKKRKESFEKLMEEHQENGIKMKQNSEGHFQVDIVVPDGMRQYIKHDYCFNKDRHSTNFFLKIGAVAFCFGHLIHSGLLLGYQIVFLTSEKNDFFACASVPTLILDLVYPLYSFFLLYFLFKYSNVIINKHIVLARFGIIHCLSASICFWIWTIIREILEAIASKQVKKEEEVEERFGEAYALPHHSYDPQGAELLRQYVNITLRRFTAVCEYDNDDSIKSIYWDISPYLYPFSVEFSILIVGIWYLIWQNIGICKAENEEEVVTTTQCNNPPSGDGSDYTESNVVVHADCQSSNKGLFGGLVALVLTIVSCILFFIAVYMTDNVRQGVFVNVITYLVMVSIMFLACAFGYRQITKLDLHTGHHNMLDDFLLFICIPAYFLNGIFSIIPAILNRNILGTISIILEVGQVLLQTVFILDGVRRSSNTRLLRKSKPGREMVTFLVIANIAMWLLQTFEVKSHEVQDDRYDFYGKELWTILGHMCLPLMMFYRFHSSVCFGDIWKFAYEPSGH